MLARLCRPRALCLRRSFSSTPTLLRQPRDRINYNSSSFTWDLDSDTASEHASYPRVTSTSLAAHNEPPRKSKMLVRDFIEDSLYNPHYGYFAKQAVIFSPEEPFDFKSVPEAAAFQEAVADRYARYGPTTKSEGGPGKQVWHTPTELFKPWYGQAIAQCIVAEYLLKYFPYEDFLIYEMGAGNGTLALNVLDFLAEEYPEVYERTQYRIIEISESLAEVQRKQVAAKHPCVEIVNKSVFDWDRHEPAPCFFLALEVVDNFAHDVVRYQLDDLTPYQGLIAVDDAGDMHELYEPIRDPLVSRFLSHRSRTSHRSPALSPIRSSQALRRLRTLLPFAPNLSPPEYIPTRLFSFLEILRAKFPLHRLLLSDFSSLPDAVPGFNAPVVQTRYQGIMVPCSTIMVQQGYFDIFFPTQFEELRDMYELLMQKPRRQDGLGIRPSPLAGTASSVRLGSGFFSSSRGRRDPTEGIISASGLPVGQRQSNVFTHKEFLEKYSKVNETTLRNGENPMLDFYENVKFLF